jgi:hypothetical protein
MPWELRARSPMERDLDAALRRLDERPVGDVPVSG